MLSSIRSRGRSNVEIVSSSSTFHTKNKTTTTTSTSKMVWLRTILLGFLAGYMIGFWTMYNAYPVLVRIDDGGSKNPCPSAEMEVKKEEQQLLSIPIPLSLQKSKQNIYETFQVDNDGGNTTHPSSSSLSFQQQQNNNNNNNNNRTKLWWKKYVPTMIRTYTPWNGTSAHSWCIPEQINHPSPIILDSGTKAIGILYIKSYKTASSTLEGICLSIAYNIAKRYFHNNNSTSSASSSLSLTTSSSTTTTSTTTSTPCQHYNRHEFADKRHHQRRGVPSLLWSFVRDPRKRDLSHVFHFEIGRYGMEPTDSKIINTIEYRIKGRQTRYLIPKKGSSNKLWPKHELRQNPNVVVEQIQHGIIDNYDFLGITERMNESLAVMVLLFHLHPGDVIVLPSKRSGGYDDAGYNATCTKIPKSYRSTEVEQYLQNRYLQNNADMLLYDVVNQSLDLTIQAIGIEKVDKVVQEIQYLQQLAESKCQHIAKFPCSETGQLQLELSEISCYVQDAACGHACVDIVMEEYRQQQKQHEEGNLV